MLRRKKARGGKGWSDYSFGMNDFGRKVKSRYLHKLFAIKIKIIIH